MTTATKRDKLLAKAEQLARDRKIKKAIVFYRQAVELDEKDIRTRLKLSELLYQSGQSGQALGILQYVGDYYRQHGFLLKSVAVYKKMLEVDRSRTDLHGTLAQLYFQLGMAPDAIRQFKAQVRALVKRGRIRDSLLVVRSMLELDSSNVYDRLRLAEQFSRLSLIDEAADELRKVLRLLARRDMKPQWGKVAQRYLHHSPDDVAVRKQVVEWLLENEDYHQALQHLHACLLKEPQDTELLQMAATSFEMLGQPAKAIVVLRNLAVGYRQRGLENEARDIWSRILSLDPKDGPARKALGMDFGDDGHRQEVELEWEMPEGFHGDGTAAPLDLEEFADGDEGVSFADSFAEGSTLVDAVHPDVFKELMNLEAGDQLEDVLHRPQVNVQELQTAIGEGRLLTPAELESFGIHLNPSEREELEFFLSAELNDEVLAILKEIVGRVVGRF